MVAQWPKPRPIVWEQNLTRWHSMPSVSSWTAFCLLCAALLAGSSALIGLGIDNLRQIGIRDVFSQGFGSINPNTLFKFPAAFSTKYGTGTYSTVQTKTSQTLFAAVIIANSPQVLFSTLYFMYNDLFTSMVTAAEWAQFATVRKALRVSKPKTGQRSTYWLQLRGSIEYPCLLCQCSYILLSHEACMLSESTYSDGTGNGSQTEILRLADIAH